MSTLICAAGVILGITGGQLSAQATRQIEMPDQFAEGIPESANPESQAARRIRAKLQPDRSRLIPPTQISPPKQHRLVKDLKNRIKESRRTASSSSLDSSTINKPGNWTRLGTTEFIMEDAPRQPSFGVIEPSEPARPLSAPSNPQPWDELNTLEALEQLAIENHPTLNAAVARILTARHEEYQAGLGPNPQLGFFVEELGVDGDAGQWGAFIQRSVIRGNKLALSRKIKNREATVLELEFEKQVYRIKTDVRTAFYKLLIAQQKNELASQLYEAQQIAILKSAKLFEGGETPKTDLLQTQLQSQKTMIIKSRSEVVLVNAWRALVSIVGKPELPYRRVTGSLEPMADTVSFEAYLEQIMINSPELQSARAEVERVRSTIDREIAETVPNYQANLNIGRDSNSNHFFTGFQIQVPLQICNQNQGNIAAAKSRLVVANNNVARIELDLTKRLAIEYQQYESAFLQSKLYTTQLLPKARETLELLTTGYPEEVGFLQLLTAQQTVIDITLEYLDSLNQLWSSRLKIEGLLLDDSLSQ